MARAMTIASQNTAKSRRKRNPFRNFMRLSAPLKGRQLRPHGFISYSDSGFFTTAAASAAAQARLAAPGGRLPLDKAARFAPAYAASRASGPTVARANRWSIDCQRSRISSAAAPRGLSSVTPQPWRAASWYSTRARISGETTAHFFKRLSAVLNARDLLGGRTLIEQEHELGPDPLKRRACSSAGPQIEQARAGRNDIEVGGLHRRQGRCAFRARRVEEGEGTP